MTRSWVRSGRHPFQVALLVVSLVSGAVGFILRQPGPSGGVERALGPLSPWFYLCLLVSASLCLTGAFWRSRDIRALQVGLHIERAGMPILAGSCGCYAALSFINTGVRALVAVLLIGGIALAALIRTRQITADLAYVRGLLDEQGNTPCPNSGADTDR